MAQIALCIPGENFNYVCVAHLLQLQAHLLGEGHTVAVVPASTNNIYITRQVINNQLREHPELDYVLWIDDDNIVEVKNFIKLFEDLEDHPEADAVCAWYWLAGHVFDGVRPSVGVFTEDQKLAHFTPDQLSGKDLLPVEWAGMGCILMRREAIDKAGDRPFRPILRDEDLLGFDGDDIAFCHRFQEGGGVMLCDPQVEVPHLKIRRVGPPLQVPTKTNKEKELAASAA